MFLAVIGELTRPTFCQKMIVRRAFCIILPFQIIVQPQKLSSDFSAFSTKTAVVKASFCSFLHAISVSRNAFKPFCALHILAMDLLFATFCLAFCCILPCVLVHFALRFGAFCLAFWCFLPCVLVLFTPNYAAKGT